jgi:hypothetical protein
MKLSASAGVTLSANYESVQSINRSRIRCLGRLRLSVADVLGRGSFRPVRGAAGGREQDRSRVPPVFILPVGWQVLINDSGDKPLQSVAHPIAPKLSFGAMAAWRIRAFRAINYAFPAPIDLGLQADEDT